MTPLDGRSDYRGRWAMTVTDEHQPAVGARTGAPISIMLRSGVRFPGYSVEDSDLASAALPSPLA